MPVGSPTYSVVHVAPDPAVSGTSLEISPIEGSYFGAPPFYVLVCPVGEVPQASNTEALRVGTVTGDVFSNILRAQAGTVAREILAGDWVISQGRPRHKVYSGTSVSHSPTDALTYYVGAFATGPNVVEGVLRTTFTRAGLITRISFHAFSTVLGSAHNTTINLRIGGATPTGGTLTTTFQHTPAVVDLIVVDLTIPVAAGDAYQFQLIHPTWTTNPTGVMYAWNVEVEEP